MATGYSMGTASGTDIPIEHLDYEYVSKCNNGKEVEKILKVLRSKTEGHYPELITHTEAKLRELNPDSKLLITSQKAKRVADLPNDQWREVTTDIEQWEHLMREDHSSATGGSDSIVDDLPPIRSGGTISGPPPQSSTDSKKRSNKPAQEPIKSFDFHTWDKYDAETAAKQAEQDDNEEEESSKGAPVCLPAVVSERELSVSSAERERLSIREKDKGNEAFKSCDYHEAMVYYSRSIQFKPSAAAYNNRALIAIKLEKYLEAVKECNEVLKMEQNNTKALLRRATAYHALKDYKEATSDLDRVLQLEPSNKRAQELLTKVKSSHLPEEKNTGSAKKKGRRIQIEEVEGEEEPSSAATTTATTSTTASVFKSPVTPSLPPPLPAHVQKLKDEGNQLFKTGQYGTAVTCYTKAIEQLRKSSTKHTLSIATLLSNRAACHLKTGDCRQCITDSTQSIVLSPVNVKALMRRATAYDTLEKFRQAYNDYHLALRLDSSQAIAHSACTRIQQYLRDQDGSNWRSKLPINPEAESVMAAYYAQAAAQQLPSGGAIPPVVTSTASSPTTSGTAVTNTTSTITNVTETSVAAGGGGGASETDNKIGKFEMLKVQGNALVKKGDCPGAIQCYTECIQLLPDEVVPYTNRALCYLKLSKYSEANVDCTRCLELQPNNVKALYRRALARKELGNYGESMRDIKKLLEVDPDNSAGLKEEGVVKELWTKKLRTIQQKQDATPPTQTSTTPSKSTSKRKKSSSKSPPTKDTKKEEKPTSVDTKPADEGAATQTKKGKGKRRKRVVVEEVTETAPEVKPEPVIREEVVVNGDRETSEPGALGEGEEREAASSRVKLADIKPEKASLFDYIQMWNSTPSSASPLDHAHLLLRIPPTSLPKVVTNKLDGNKLSSIIAALHHHIMPEELYTSVYDILLSLSRVDRFSTITMFLSTNDKQSLEAIFSSLSTHLPSLAAVQQLRATYL